MHLPLSATRLSLHGTVVESEPLGDLVDTVRAHLRGGVTPGLVVLGPFGSGKTHLCSHVAALGELPVTVVPLRDVARHPTIDIGLDRVIGRGRLDEAQAGRRVLLLDGLDEVPPPPEGHPAYFQRLVELAGPRWVMTSRPSHFRTDAAEPIGDQVDVLSRPDVATVVIDPIAPHVARSAVSHLPRGLGLLETVEGLVHIATSPLILRVVEAAAPFIEPGRPIQPWGVFDAWIRHALSTGKGHSAAVDKLEDLAWQAFLEGGRSMAVPTFSAEAVGDLHPELRRALMVTELDGRMRFAHRSVYEFLLAVRFAPAIAANQGKGRDDLSGLRITDAIRMFLLGRTGAMPVIWDAGRVRIPAGNFVAGGELSPDERELRIEHLERPVWLSRTPVTNREWEHWLDVAPDNRIDAYYLRHWGLGRTVPRGQEDHPVYNLWPEDADKFAKWRGARLPSADELEKAIRGLDGRRWPWGDHFLPRAVTSELGVERPLPVRAFGAHGDAALYQPVGGVFQYTSSDYRGRADRGRVVMGGCYTHPAPVSRASLRLSHKLSGHLKAGLRLAWDAAE